MSMSCFDCHDYMDGYNRGKKEGSIEELKQIEKRFEEEIERSVNTNRYRDGIAFCKAVIHNTITKLKGENKMEKEYKLGNCPCCQKTDLVIVDKKIICKFCNNWAWLEDARNSSWLKELKGEEQ